VPPPKATARPERPLPRLCLHRLSPDGPRAPDEGRSKGTGGGPSPVVKANRSQGRRVGGPRGVFDHDRNSNPGGWGEAAKELIKRGEFPSRVRLYSGSTTSFVDDTTRNRIGLVLTEEFARVFGHPPSDGERRSWTNSLQKVKDVLQVGRLRDHGIMLEYQLPFNSRRLDCLLTGRDQEGLSRAEIIELKQWDHCESVDEPNEVLTEVGHGRRIVLHPSVQVANYQQYIEDMHTAFYGDGPILLGSSAYLHNFQRINASPLFDSKFASTIADHPLYLAEDFDQLVARLRDRLGKGGGLPILQRIERAPLRPSRKLMEHVSAVIGGDPVYRLLDEQVVSYDAVRRAVGSGGTDGPKCAIIVKGGPGTGKSVIAVNLLADLLRAGVDARHVTGSKAFTESLRRSVGSRASSMFGWTLSFANLPPDSVAVAIVDEAHRIRLRSANRFTPKANRTDLPQIQEILRAARVSVFFIDDLQAVRPNEVGTSEYIWRNANDLGIPVEEFELDIQFRCMGSDAFVSWMDGLLGLASEAVEKYRRSREFDFRIADSPTELEALLRERARTGKTTRIVAGFCWEWSDPRTDGTLVPDVRIGDFARPWNAKPYAGRLAKGIPKAVHWATDPKGTDQIGCIYTAQGFEFDFVGVIVGPDLGVDPPSGRLCGLKSGSADPGIKGSPERCSELIRRAYRVLLSRGMEGCYVYFTDPETRRFFEQRLEDGPPN
jgi:hypothetical protein